MKTPQEIAREIVDRFRMDEITDRFATARLQERIAAAIEARDAEHAEWVSDAYRNGIAKGALIERKEAERRPQAVSDEEIEKAAETHAAKVCIQEVCGVEVSRRPVTDPDMRDSFIAGAKWAARRNIKAARIEDVWPTKDRLAEIRERSVRDHNMGSTGAGFDDACDWLLAELKRRLGE